MHFASLFSGCGGFDIGFAARGFQPHGAYDTDTEAVDNFAANVTGPVTQIDLTRGIPNESSLIGIDALIAGPPCQGFSTAGKRRLNDERNHLVTLTGILARRLSPQVLVVENVSGALWGEHARYLKGLDLSMRLAGYKTYLLRCQTADLGMAQIRRRVLLFAWKTKREIRFNAAKSAASDLRCALAGVSKQPNHNPRRLSRGSRERLIAQRIKPGQKLSNVRGGSNALATWDIPEVFGVVSRRRITVLSFERCVWLRR